MAQAVAHAALEAGAIYNRQGRIGEVRGASPRREQRRRRCVRIARRREHPLIHGAGCAHRECAANLNPVAFELDRQLED